MPTVESQTVWMTSGEHNDAPLGKIFPENGLLCIRSFVNRKESLPLYTHLHAIESTLHFEKKIILQSALIK